MPIFVFMLTLQPNSSHEYITDAVFRLACVHCARIEFHIQEVHCIVDQRTLTKVYASLPRLRVDCSNFSV